ncbi:CCA tRNA nucleotidyltransferase [Candidatus Micrarchaeota archaeon]|nr:CCA tRNA nucleotidyltransferase [Candidatus Micrarchaeota archaeon]
METYRSIFSKVLKRVKPTLSEEKRNKKVFNEIITRLKKVINDDIEIELVGSFAKGTHVRNKREFDIFLLFPKKYTKKEISELCITWGREVFSDTLVAYAQHPYLRVKYKGFSIDLVPAYHIKNASERATAVDRSPFHTKYINNRLTKKQKDEVRILKQFLKGLNIYGAELRVEGFSGYLAELLIVRYKSILTLFKEASDWQFPVIIDIENHGTSDKFSDPFIMIDPVDPNRNVAAVVSTTSLARFIFYARLFLRKPSTTFFFPRKPRIDKSKLKTIIRKRNTKVYVYEFDAPDVIEDILWPQLKKTTYSIKRKLESMEYRIFGFYYWSDNVKCVIMFELYHDKLPDIVRLVGPSITRKHDVDKFMDKHKTAVDMQIVHDRITAIKKRRFTSFDHAFNHIITDKSTGLPDRFRKLIKKHKKLNISSFVDRYPEIAYDYFTRTIKV